MIKLYPSLMAANLVRLRDQIDELQPLCDGFHLDIMDDHFVPNLTFGADMVNQISKITTKQLWVHLMMQKNIDFIKKCRIPAQSIISFHIESSGNVYDLIKITKENNYLPSIAISPKTDVGDIFPYLDIIDQVLVMSVEPGYSGQRFIASVIAKVDQLITIRKKKKLSFNIGMDGGINEENIAELAAKGVEDFAIGSALFGSTNLTEKMKEFRKITSP